MKESGFRVHRLRPLARIALALKSVIPVVMIGMLLIAGVPAFGQEVTGNIQGKVTDPSGAVVQGATVELITEQRTFTTTTDAEGGYQFQLIRPGMHRMRVTASGFGTQERTDVALELGRNLGVNWELQVVGAGEVVDVTTSSEPIVDITSTKIATNVTKEEFDLIPKTLNFSSVINVAPGVRQEDKSAGFTVDGASGAENVFILDGVEVTRVEDGQLGSTKNVPFDFVREVQIKSAGYEAEFAGATGGVINVVTRSGQNDYHGEVRFEFQNDALTAAPNPILRLNPNDQSIAEYYNPSYREDEFSFFAPVLSLNGPLAKDKAWFYASWAPQFTTVRENVQLVTYQGLTPTILGQRQVEEKTTFNYYFGRVDYSPWDKLQTYVSFIGSPVKTEGRLIGGALNEVGSRPLFEDQRHQFKGGFTPSWNLAAAATWNATDALVFSFRGGRTYLNDKGGNYDIPIGQPYYRIQVPCPAGTFNCPSGTTTGGEYNTTNRTTVFNVTTRTNFNVDATYITRFFDQQHIIKGGYQLNRLSNKVDEGFTGGLFDFYFDRARGGVRGDYGYYRLIDFGTRGDVNSRAQAIFIQDAWTVHPRLTLNLGLRMEHEFLPTFPIDPTFHPTIDPSRLAGAPDRPIEFGWRDKLAPRIGVAWDVLGDQRLKIYGSFGVFYDTMKYELPRGSFGGDRYLLSYYTLDTLDFTQISMGNLIGTQIGETLDFRVPSSLSPEPGEQPGIDPNLDPTRQHEFTVGGDWAFNNNLVFGVRFTRKELDRTIEDVGRHDADFNEIYTIGNPGYGATQNTEWFAPIAAPKAVREYTGLEFRLDKRFSNNWYGNVTYLWSKLYGNYTGLASADEVTYTTGQGRSSPNVNRYWDFPTLLFTATGEETLGRLPTDRPHTLKAYGGYKFKWWGMETDVSGAQLAYSGTPVTTRAEVLYAEHIPFGRGDLGRTEAFTQTDLLISHSWGITERVRIKGSFNVLNLWDERNESVRYELLSAVGYDLAIEHFDLSTPEAAYNEYFNIGRERLLQLHQQDGKIDPRFNLPTIFQSPRAARFAIGVEF